jgi:2-oxo-3-hexenedioate decarboxylase
MRRADVQDIAREAIDLLGTGRQTAPFTATHPGFAIPDAYLVTAAVRAAREARGERVVGRKIGFTNRTIWDEYGVHTPIWGYVYDATVHDLVQDSPAAGLRGLAEPRIEPEIVFALASPPAAGMDERALLGSIDWIAHGFEIVQSIFPHWTFRAADTVAAYGLHGMLWIGPRRPVAPREEAWAVELPAFDIDLYRNGVVAVRGKAANVLGGPVSALKALVDALAADPSSPPLAAGEIVTTGTLTRALPVAPGETWSTTLTGVPLDGLSIRFV